MREPNHSEIRVAWIICVPHGSACRDTRCSHILDSATDVHGTLLMGVAEICTIALVEYVIEPKRLLRSYLIDRNWSKVVLAHERIIASCWLGNQTEIRFRKRRFLTLRNHVPGKRR